MPTTATPAASPLDPELVAALADLAPHLPPVPARGDWQGLRAFNDQLYPLLGRQAATYPGVTVTSYDYPAAGGGTLAARWYQPATPPTGAAVVYAHGGGRLAGSLDQYEFVLRRYAYETGVPFLSVDYHLAPEGHGTAQAENLLAACTWLQARAPELHLDPARLALMGDSGGGGVAAGAVILAHQRQVPVARQLLVYPMLDDRNQVPDPALVPHAVWTYDNNYTGWAALLGEAAVGQPGVSAVAAPARLQDFAGLPPTYLEVGDLDIFRDETLAYAQHLAQAAVPTELHLWPGVPHASDLVSSVAAVSQRAWQARVRVVRSL